MKTPINVNVLRSLMFAVALTAFLSGCASRGSSWTAQATYHALVVASQYQEQFKVIGTRLVIPGPTPEEIEESASKPLDQSVNR